MRFLFFFRMFAASSMVLMGLIWSDATAESSRTPADSPAPVENASNLWND